MQSPPCFFICFILLLTGTSRADSDVSFTFKRAEDILSDFDSASGAPSLEDETNLENPFISDSSSFSPLGSNLFTNSDLDNSLISTSIGPNMPIGNDEPSVDLFADTSEKCSLDPNSKVNRRGEACLPAIGNPASLIENFQSQPGVLTPEAIDEAIRTTPYGLVLTSESDYAWCDPQFQRKYAICDSGFSFDRIPLPTPPLYDLYDCTSCVFFPLPPSLPLGSNMH